MVLRGKPYGSGYHDLFREARWAIHEALKLHPTFADAHLELARLAAAEGYLVRDAEPPLRNALRFAEAPEIAAAIAHQLAVLNDEVDGPLEETAMWLEYGIATGGSAPESRVACAAIHIRLGDRARATTQMEEAVDALPDYGPAWVLLGLLRVAAGDLDGAAEALARGGEVLGLEADTQHTRRVGEGIAYQRVGRAEAAVETLAPELLGYLPASDELFGSVVADEGEKPPPRRDLERVATAVCNGVLVTHLGEPVIRAEPEPVEEEASDSVGEPA